MNAITNRSGTPCSRISNFLCSPQASTNHKGLSPHLSLLQREDLKMLSQIQRFGGAMFTPVLLFPCRDRGRNRHNGRNPLFVGEALTAPDNLFAQIVHIIEEGGWAVFRNMPLILPLAYRLVWRNRRRAAPVWRC